MHRHEAPDTRPCLYLGSLFAFLGTGALFALPQPAGVGLAVVLFTAAILAARHHGQASRWAQER